MISKSMLSNSSKIWNNSFYGVYSSAGFDFFKKHRVSIEFPFDYIYHNTSEISEITELYIKTRGFDSRLEAEKYKLEELIVYYKRQIQILITKQSTQNNYWKKRPFVGYDNNKKIPKSELLKKVKHLEDKIHDLEFTLRNIHTEHPEWVI